LRGSRRVEVKEPCRSEVAAISRDVFAPLRIFVFGRWRILKFADFPEGRHFSQPDSSSAAELAARQK